MTLPFFWSGSWLSHTPRERVAIISVKGWRIDIYIYVALTHVFCMHGGSFILQFVSTLINHTTDGVMSFLKATVNKMKVYYETPLIIVFAKYFSAQ